jgi:hypothetical protein
MTGRHAKAPPKLSSVTELKIVPFRRKAFMRQPNTTRTIAEGISLAAALLLLASATPGLAQQSSHHIRIRVINAKTNQPIPDERLNVALRSDQIGSVAMPTDKNGIIDVDYGHATTIRILSNMYGDCRPRGELYTDYSIAEIRRTGITAGNLCSDASPAPKPGVLLLFETPKTFIPQYPAPPGDTLPHHPN